MRICIISKEYPPDTGWGGIGTYSYEIAHGLSELGHEVEVVALAAKDSKPKSSTVVDDGPIKVHRVPWQDNLQELATMWISIPYSHFMIKTNLALWNKFAALHKSKPFDVVEAPEHLAEGVLPSVAGSAPIVIKLHTPQSKFIAEKFHNLSSNFDQQLIAMFERVGMLSADWLISPSEDLADFVSRDLNYPREAITIVRNPLDANKFSPEGTKALPSDDRLTVMFAGRLEERKGIHCLIDAVPEIVRQFPNVRFIVIGKDTNTAKGNRSMLGVLKESLERSGCGNAVTFIAGVPLSEMPSYYRSADICIAPSLYDNAPYTCLEAISCGKPFIGTTAGGMKEYLNAADSGLVIPPGDKTAIVESVLTLLRDPALRERFSTNARQYALSDIHRTRVAEKNISIYKQAQQRFAERQGARLYLHGTESAIADTTSMVFAYHRMLYDLLYQHSYLFRAKHFVIFVCQRPRLALAKAALVFGKLFLRPLGLGTEALNRLQETVTARETEREAQLTKQYGYVEA